MGKITKRTISLSEEQSAWVDAKVASGQYTSASEVFREGLRGLQAQDAALDTWLTKEIPRRVKDLRENPHKVTPIDEAFDEIYEYIETLKADEQ